MACRCSHRSSNSNHRSTRNGKVRFLRVAQVYPRHRRLPSQSMHLRAMAACTLFRATTLVLVEQRVLLLALSDSSIRAIPPRPVKAGLAHRTTSTVSKLIALGLEAQRQDWPRMAPLAALDMPLVALRALRAVPLSEAPALV